MYVVVCDSMGVVTIMTDVFRNLEDAKEAARHENARLRGGVRVMKLVELDEKEREDV